MIVIASEVVSFTDSLIFCDLNTLYVLISFVVLFYRDKLMKPDFNNLNNGIMWYIVFFTHVDGQYPEAALMYNTSAGSDDERNHHSFEGGGT